MLEIDSFFNLLINLLLTSLLFVLAKWFMGYIMSWWLRIQRISVTYSTMKDFAFLKIKLPRDVFKTPAAMEVVLLTLNQGLGHRNMPTIPKIEFTPFYNGKDKKFSFRLFTYYDNGGNEVQQYVWVQVMRENFFFKYIKGALRSWSSLEIVSDAGEIYFLVATKSNNKEIFKQYAFSQFPGIEINEVAEDPLNKFHYTNQKTGDTQIYVGKYATKGGLDHLPIKTYVDYGLDKEMVKDEYKIDPMVVLLENMSQAKKGEMYWFQILIRPTIYNAKDDTSEHPYDWVGVTTKKINEILGYKAGEDIEVDDGHGGKKKIKGPATIGRGLLSLTLTEKHQVEIMQRNLEKPGFDCIVKMFYWVDKKVNPNGLDLARGIMTIVNATKPFGKPGYNSLDFATITTDGDTPFLDPTGVWTEIKRFWHWKMAKLRAGFYQEAPGAEFFWIFFKKILQRWKETGNWTATGGLRNEIKEYWLYPGIYPHRGDGYDHGNGFVLNSEELATLWHFPGAAFGHSESKVGSVKADPPSNLPI